MTDQETASGTGIAVLGVVALDCPDPHALACFYSALVGAPIAHDTGDWVQLAATGGVALAFQHAPGHVPPEWPGDEQPQQVHLDFDVPDLDDAEPRVLALGARKHEVQPGENFRVYLDPAGHPFCLVKQSHPVGATG
jgi:catechol 2,3-dioxygenase-like lactoylglutathione lyase family enzyme